MSIRIRYVVSRGSQLHHTPHSKRVAENSVTASPLPTPNAMRPFAAASTRRWNSPVVMLDHAPGPVLRAAMVVALPVRAMRSVSSEYSVSSSFTVTSPGEVYSLMMVGMAAVPTDRAAGAVMLGAGSSAGLAAWAAFD